MRCTCAAADCVYDQETSPARSPYDGERWPAKYVSSNGASAGVWTEKARRLVALGYITAIALPVIGLIVGIVVVMRPAKAISKHGVWIIVLSLMASIAWILVLSSGALTSTNNELS